MTEIEKLRAELAEARRETDRRIVCLYIAVEESTANDVRLITLRERAVVDRLIEVMAGGHDVARAGHTTANDMTQGPIHFQVTHPVRITSPDMNWIVECPCELRLHVVAPKQGLGSGDEKSGGGA